MDTDLSLKETVKEWHGTYKSYLIGFIASLVLTSISFLLILTKYFDTTTTIFTVVGLALVQAIFQIRYFLHLGSEPKPRWESAAFYFMVLILLIIVLGTLWIMYDLNMRMMPEGMKM